MAVNEITAAKVEFQLELDAADIKVVEYIPGRIVPPVVVISAAGTYLEPSSIASEYLMNLELMLVSQTATNAKATEALDALIEKVLKALPHYAQFKSVGQPYQLQTNNAEYLAANVAVDLRITI
jgi:hypothetical protein